MLAAALPPYGFLFGAPVDALSILAARNERVSDGVEYVEGNVLTWPFEASLSTS